MWYIDGDQEFSVVDIWNLYRKQSRSFQRIRVWHHLFLGGQQRMDDHFKIRPEMAFIVRWQRSRKVLRRIQMLWYIEGSRKKSRSIQRKIDRRTAKRMLQQESVSSSKKGNLKTRRKGISHKNSFDKNENTVSYKNFIKNKKEAAQKMWPASFLCTRPCRGNMPLGWRTGGATSRGKDFSPTRLRIPMQRKYAAEAAHGARGE